MIVQLCEAARGHVCPESKDLFLGYLRGLAGLDSMGYVSLPPLPLDEKWSGGSGAERWCPDIKGTISAVELVDMGDRKSVIRLSKMIGGIKEHKYYIDTINGILMLARLISVGDITDKNVIEYCKLDMAQRLLSVGSEVSDWDISSLARRLEYRSYIGDKYSHGMDWYSGIYDYQFIGDSFIYIEGLHRGYTFEPSLSELCFFFNKMSFSPNGNIARLESLGGSYFIMDLMNGYIASSYYVRLFGVNVYEGSLGCVKRQLMLS